MVVDAELPAVARIVPVVLHDQSEEAFAPGDGRFEDKLGERRVALALGLRATPAVTATTAAERQAAVMPGSALKFDQSLEERLFVFMTIFRKMHCEHQASRSRVTRDARRRGCSPSRRRGP